MAAFMCQDVHQVAAFMHEFFLAWIAGVEPVDLDEFSVLNSGSGIGLLRASCF
jgi:hypothetical protein